MKKSTYRKAIALFVTSLCSTHVYATTSYSSEGHLTLEITGFTDSGGQQFDFDNHPQ